jgi:signal transduction histidine kinase
MIKQNTLVAKPTEVIPTDSKSFLRRAPEGLERLVAGNAARPAETNEQLRHEINERRRAEELLLKEQSYLRYLLELQDRDRQMVSCEIHDGLVQQLAAAIMQLEMFSRLAGPSDSEAWKTFETGRQRLNECMREARRLINGLRSPVLDELGVVAVIEDLISENGDQDKPEIVFVHHLDRERLAPSLENVIFRIVQESFTNARRYSQSDRLLVRLTQRDDCIRIEVQDWGIGFNPREVGSGHFGLEGIQLRARLFGGSATIESALGMGTRIVVQLPLMGDVGTVIPAADLDESCGQPDSRSRRSEPIGKGLLGD